MRIFQLEDKAIALGGSTHIYQSGSIVNLECMVALRCFSGGATVADLELANGDVLPLSFSDTKRLRDMLAAASKNT